MKKLFVAIMLTLSLMGCSTLEKIEPVIVTKQEYILRVPPKEAMTIPPEVQDIDLATAKEAEVARWLLLIEERMNMLEKAIEEVAKFLDEEQKKLDSK